MTPEYAMEAEPLPMETAPRDSTMVRLLVEFDDETGHHALVDDVRGWTIGSNGFDNDGIDEWRFIGWSWCQDVFFDCTAPNLGRVVGWLPFYRTSSTASNEEVINATHRLLLKRKGMMSRLADLEEVDLLRETNKTLLASLVAATSLLENGGKKAAPSDTMFDMMIAYYKKAITAGRALLSRDASDDETSRCIACDQPMLDGQLYYPDASGGELHAECCGPEREAYTINGEPLKDSDPIPEPNVWKE